MLVLVEMMMIKKGCCGGSSDGSWSGIDNNLKLILTLTNRALVL